MAAELVPVYLAVLMDSVGAYMVVPVLPFVAKEMDATPFMIGFMQALYCITQVFGTLILGRAGDHVGRGKVLLVSLFFSTISLLGFGIARSMLQLLVFRGLNGFFAGTVSVCQAIVADVTTEEERTGKMALSMAAYGLGVVIGPVAAALIVHFFGSGHFGFLVLCITAASLTMANFFLGLCTLRGVGPLPVAAAKDQDSGGDSSSAFVLLLRCLLCDQLFGVLFCVTFLQNAAFSMFMGTAALVVNDLYGMQAGELGVIYCAAGATMVVFQGFVTQPASERLGSTACIAVGSGIRGACFAAVAAVASPYLAPLYFVAPLRPLVPWLVPVMAVAAAAFIDPCSLSLVSEHAPPGSAGLVLGAFNAVGSLGAFVGPLLGGYLYGISIPAAYWSAAALSAVCIPIVSLLSFRRGDNVPPMKEELAASLLKIEDRQTRGMNRMSRAHSTVQFSLPIASVVEAEVSVRDSKAQSLQRAFSERTPARRGSEDFGKRLQRRFTLPTAMSAEWPEQMDSVLET